MRRAIAPRRVVRIARASTRAWSSALVHPSAQIGARCQIHPSAAIGADVVIGDDAIISAHVSLQHCILGAHVILHSGVCIGQDGFGFAFAADGTPRKKPQELLVEIHDHVEIGANCTIDRGSWRNTIIGAGCKLDNLIQIAHNVQLGRGCVIAAQTGIAGSTTIGQYVQIGGQVGIAQHLKIGDNVRIAAKSGVMHDLAGDATYGGTPAVSIMEYRRQLVRMRSLGQKHHKEC